MEIAPDLADRVARELSSDERLVWLGQPRLDIVAWPAFIMVPFGIVFTWFALSWMNDAPGLAAAFGIPFVAAGVGLVLSPLWLRAVARRTVYAVTDRRAIIWEPRLLGGVDVQSFTASGLGQMSRTERSDGCGDLVFRVTATGFGDRVRTEQQGFMGIDRVRDVEDLIRKTLQLGRST